MRRGAAREGLAYLACGLLSMAASYVVMWLVNTVCFAGIGRADTFQNVVLGCADWTAGMLAAFVLTRRFVFRSRGPILPELGRHAASRVGTLALGISVRLLAGAMGAGTWFCAVMSSAVTTVVNYGLAKWFVFRPK